MKKYFVAVFILLLGLTSGAQNEITKSEKELIMSLLDKQVEAWNEGNIEKFMETYWKSDKLVFMGSRGPTYGWQATLDSYKKGYPDKTAMGHLKFKILEMTKIDTKTVFVIGRFELTREIGDLAGHFTLIIQKIDGKWVIISDHSSGEN